MIIVIPQNQEEAFHKLMESAEWEAFEFGGGTDIYTPPPYIKQPIPASLRWEIWERDNFTCQKCGARRFLQVDHIKPEVKGGETIDSNLQTLCKPCNVKKGAIYEL